MTGMCGGLQKNKVFLVIVLGKNFEILFCFLYIEKWKYWPFILESAGFVPALQPALYCHP